MSNKREKKIQTFRHKSSLVTLTHIIIIIRKEYFSSVFVNFEKLEIEKEKLKNRKIEDPKTFEFEFVICDKFDRLAVKQRTKTKKTKIKRLKTTGKSTTEII